MDLDKVKQLLAVPLPNRVVADAVGCDESRISQLMADENFAAEVQRMRSENLAVFVERDKKYDTLEDQLLDKLETLLPMLVNPMAVVNALKTINSAKRRAVPAELAGASAKHEHVHLHLPTIIQNTFVVNNQNQVVQVGDKVVATMPASAVVRKLDEMKNNGEKNVIEHKKDEEVASERLENIKKLTHMPVHAVI